MRKKYITGLIIAIAFVLGVGAGVTNMYLGSNKMYYTASNGSSGEEAESINTVDPKYTFRVVKMIIDKNYVEKIDDKLYNEMSVDLAKGMLRELSDANCKFVDDKEMTLLENATRGEFEGIGVKTYIKTVDVNGINEEKLFVGSVIPGGAAWRSGIKPDDIIISVNDKEILPYNPLARAEKILNDFQKKYQRAKLKETQEKLDKEYDRIGKGITIFEAEKLISYKSDKTLKIKTNRDEYKLVANNWKLDSVKKTVSNNIPTITVQYLGNDTGEMLGNYLNESRKSKLIILDLRDVFGGTYESGMSVAKWFVPNTQLGILKTKEKDLVLQVPENENPWKGQTIILVNKGTNKYGELLARAIGRNKSSVIMGETTRGDLKDITIFDLPNMYGFTLTTGEYILKDKAKNVVPDIKTNGGINGKPIEQKDFDKACEYLKGGKK